MSRVFVFAMLATVAFAQEPNPRRPTVPSPQIAPQGRTQPQGLSNEVTPQLFVQQVVDSNMKEIDIAKLAATRAQSADVKAFGAMLVTDHSKALEAIRGYAQRKNITVSAATKPETSTSTSTSPTHSTSTATTPPRAQNTPSSSQQTGDRADAQRRTETPKAGTAGQAAADTQHAAHFKELSAKSGAEFDRAFIALMVENHEKGVALFERQSQAKLGDAELQKFINDTLPTLRRHLAKANELQTNLTGRNTTRTPNR